MANPRSKLGVSIFQGVLSFMGNSGLAGFAMRFIGPETEGVTLPTYKF
jgi:hypothetical protein